MDKPTELSQDEYTCLLIATEGEVMLAIGRWKPALESLAKKSFMKRVNGIQYAITDEGREAAKLREQEDDEALATLMRPKSCTSD